MGASDNPEHRFVARLADLFARRFPYFAGTVARQVEEFGPSWAETFSAHMEATFGADPAAFDAAVEGYGRFALDAMKLQKSFDKTRRYEPKSYAAAAAEVYQNPEYMRTLYLPGILLSHYLWRHHYRQYLFFQEVFLEAVRRHPGRRFYDVGVGTGFYSKEMLVGVAGMTGAGFDLSPTSLEHTRNLLARFGVADRYAGRLRDVVAEPVDTPADALLCIEVLEHLEDPQTFLDALARMLAPGGLGLISAALTAPNADHIYLYTEAEEVADQLRAAGFTIVRAIEDAAYEPRRPGDSVPRNAAFMVTR